MRSRSKQYFLLLYVSLICLVWAPLWPAPALDKRTVAILDGKEKVSLEYFRVIYEKLKKDPSTSNAIRRYDYSKTFAEQVLMMIADDYIMAREALRAGYHNSSSFANRLRANLYSYFAEYVTTHLVEQKVLPRRDQYNKVALEKYLIKKYQLEIFVSGIDQKNIFRVRAPKGPDIEYYGQDFPKASPLVKARYNKKTAEKHKLVAYTNPADGETTTVNLREYLDGLYELHFAKFRKGTALARHEMVKKRMVSRLISAEFKTLSKGDPRVEEFIKRIEQSTLAERYRVMKGYSPATPYLMPDLKLPKLPVTEEQIANYWKNHKRDFARPHSADVWSIRLAKNQDEVDEGDALVSELREMDFAVKRAEGDYWKLRDERGALRRRFDNLPAGSDDQAKQIKEKLASLEKEIKQAREDWKKTRLDTARKKFKRFREFMKELNNRSNRQNGQVPRSVHMGNIRYTQKLSLQKNIAFTVKPGNQSVLFDTGEGYYAILFVKKKKLFIPHHTDPDTRRRINYRLQEKLRREQMNDLLDKRRPEVLPKKAVNQELLSSFAKNAQ